MIQADKNSADFAEHRRSYDEFVRMALIVVFLLLSHLAALAVGGLTHLWILACLEVGLSILAAIVGAAIHGLDWKPGAVVLVLCLLTLAVATG